MASSVLVAVLTQIALTSHVNSLPMNRLSVMEAPCYIIQDSLDHGRDGIFFPYLEITPQTQEIISNYTNPDDFVTVHYRQQIQPFSIHLIQNVNESNVKWLIIKLESDMALSTSQIWYFTEVDSLFSIPTQWSFAKYRDYPKISMCINSCCMNILDDVANQLGLLEAIRYSSTKMVTQVTQQINVRNTTSSHNIPTVQLDLLQDTVYHDHALKLVLNLSRVKIKYDVLNSKLEFYEKIMKLLNIPSLLPFDIESNSMHENINNVSLIVQNENQILISKTLLFSLIGCCGLVLIILLVLFILVWWKYGKFGDTSNISGPNLQSQMSVAINSDKGAIGKQAEANQTTDGIGTGFVTPVKNRRSNNTTKRLIAEDENDCENKNELQLVDELFVEGDPTNIFTI